MGGRTEIKADENGEDIPMMDLNLGKNVIKVPMVNGKFWKRLLYLLDLQPFYQSKTEVLNNSK